MIGRRPEGWSRIGNFLIWWARVRTNSDWRSDGDIWIAILALFMSASRWETTSSGRCTNRPISELGKNLKLIDHWWASRRAAEMSRRMQVGTEASRYNGGSGRKDTSFERMMLVCVASGRDEHVVQTDGTVDRWTSGRDNTSSGRLTGSLKSSIFFRSAESSENALTSGIPIYSIFTHKWFHPNTEWGQNTNRLQFSTVTALGNDLKMSESAQ
jgi:hypothetical protein